MFNVEKLKLSGYFKEKTLSRGELLFDEGKIDDNLYYIQSGKISIEKYTTKLRKHTKQLSIIKKGAFLGEGSLKYSKNKEVKALILEETKVLYIDAKNDFISFMKKYPESAKEILVDIIYLTNKRTLESNKYITSLYEINRIINKLEKINYLEIFNILNKINEILEGNYVLYLEINPVNKNFLSLKYDSRFSLKMQDKLVEKGHYKLTEIGINKEDRIITKKISVGKEELGHIIVGRKEIFSQNEKRIFLAMVNSLFGILKQKKILEEEMNLEFSKN